MAKTVVENRFNESDSTKGVTGIAVAVYTVVILALLVFGALLVYGGVFGVNGRVCSRFIGN